MAAKELPQNWPHGEIQVSRWEILVLREEIRKLRREIQKAATDGS